MDQHTDAAPEFKGGKIHAAIIAAMKGVEKISKTRKSDASTGGYSFRGIDDIYNELHDVLAEAGIFSTSRILKAEHVAIKTSSGKDATETRLTVRWYFWAEDGSFVCHDTEGVGRDTQDKAANKAMSVGHKYALIQILAIPTADAKDPEDARHDAAVDARRPQSGPPAQRPQAGPPPQRSSPAPAAPAGQPPKQPAAAAPQGAAPAQQSAPAANQEEAAKLEKDLDAKLKGAANKEALAAAWAEVMKMQKKLTKEGLFKLRSAWQERTAALGA